jgi:hypothetical protein
MDSYAGWFTYDDALGSSISLGSTPGWIGNALGLCYSLRQQDAWVGVYKEIDPVVLSGLEGLSFRYTGTGAPNTIELKLLYGPDAEDKRAVFSVYWPAATDAAQVRTLEAAFSDFWCWPNTGCTQDDKLDPAKVRRIDFAISCKQGDTPGQGMVTIDDLRGMQARNDVQAQGATGGP